MRSPEHRNTYSNRRNQVYDNEISSRFTTPGAFTVLPPDDVAPPDPPLAPQPYRLTPSARRHKNMSFAILAEPTSAPGSRSPSPTGRVSPFRGRGFNPIGSRHASPIPSPPPEEMYKDVNEVSRHSKIPRLSRRGSAAAFGEKINDYQASPKGKLHSQLSQSLTNIAPKKVTNRPPPSPRRRQGYSKPPAFQRLSPIVGSSPEPSQSQSSPKNINTRSQPHKSNSPVRSQSFVNRPPRPTSKAPSRNTSREPSPNKNPTSPTRIPVKQHYKNVQAKVNSFSKPKPKVPPKPQVLNEETTEESDNTVNTRRKIPRKETVKLRTNSKNNVIPKAVTNSNNKSNNNNKTNNKNDTLKETVNDKSGNNTNVKEAANKTVENIKEDLDKITEIKDDIEIKQESTNTVVDNSSENDTKTKPQEEVKKTESPVKLADLLQPSTTTVVSSTTSTVTQPLKIEAKIDMDPKIDSISKSDNKTMSPIVDGRVLSATSVSNAMNKMNDTVLNTRTLMKETGLTKLSPAASSIIAMSNVSKQTNPALDTKNATTALPSVEEIRTKPLENNSKSTDNKDKTTDNKDKTTDNKAKPTDNKDKQMDNNQKPPENNHKPLENNHKRPENTNHITTTGIISAKALEEHVQNNMSKLISPDHIVSNSVQKSVNDRIIEARTVVAHDVKPIKITVKEKPMDADVQSGNIRFDTSNGLNEIPGLPPPQQPGNEPQPEVQEPPKGNACTRFFATWKKKMNFKTCKRQKPENNEEIKNTEEKPAKAGCFNCRKKKPDVTINIENDEPKQKIWDRLKCCSKNKVGDTGCFPIGKRKSNWTERQDSIMSEPRANKSRCSKRSCTNLFRRLFCLDKCRKNKKKIEEDNISRRASMMSKKKSLTPSVPVEDNKPKIDISLVEHSSQMRGAIPVLPVCLAWFCLVMNCIGPGTGTILSGLFCLCIGKPRFSQKDGPKPRIGAFIIDLIIGFGQFFTVLFCLVGWGWSIWWGVIMVKIAKKHKKIKMLEANAMEHEGSRQVPPNQNHSRDPERGS